MNHKKAFILSWIPSLALMGMLFLISGLPGSALKAPPFPFSDKIAHFLAYSVLGLALFMRRPLRQFLVAGRVSPFSLLGEATGFIVGIAFALSDEIHQYYVPYRTCDAMDFIADGLGVVAGFCIIRAILPRLDMEIKAN